MKNLPPTRNSEGSALVLSLMVLLVVSALIGIVFSLTSGTRNQIDRGTKYAQAQAAAEGALEYAYGIWVQEITNNKGPVDTATLNNHLSAPPAFEGVSFRVAPRIDAINEFGVPVANATGISMDSRQFPGWRAYAYNYVASVTTAVALPSGESVDFVLRRTFSYSHMPVFGAMFFFENDFELYMPAPMIINGNVHTNQAGYVTTHYTTYADKLRFSADSRVTHVEDWNQTVAPYGAQWQAPPGSNGPANYELGMAAQVKKSDYMQALGTGSADEFDPNDGNPNNDGNRELIEPPNPNFPDPPAIAASRLYNKAGLIVEITGPLAADPVMASGGNFVAQNLKIKPANGTALTPAQAQALRNSIINSKIETVTVPRTYQEEYEDIEYQTVQQEVQVTQDNWVYERVRRGNSNRYDWVWVNYPTTTTQIQNVQVPVTVTKTRSVTVYEQVEQHVPTSIYDRREGKYVDVSTLNINAARPTLESISDFNGVIYIHDTSGTGSNQPKAIRLANGGVAPADGLTIASENGIYIQGDFNTGTTNNPLAVPANNGNANNDKSPVIPGYKRAPVAVAGDMVTILSNAWNDNNSDKALTSRVASNTTINAAIISGFIPGGWVNENGVKYGYSGGANNFPRFLENWTGKFNNYHGSMVQLYNSEVFTGRWDTGQIYGAPTRRWNFEPLFESISPPGRVNVTSFSRGTWQRG